MKKLKNGLKVNQVNKLIFRKFYIVGILSAVVMGAIIFLYLSVGKTDSVYAAPLSGEAHDIAFNTLPFVDNVTGTVITDYSPSTVLSTDEGIRHSGAGGNAGFDIRIPGDWIGTTSTTLFFVFRKMENDATMIVRGSNLRIWMLGSRLNVMYTTSAGVVTSNVTTDLAGSDSRQKYEIGFTYDQDTGIGRLWLDSEIIWENNGSDNTPLLYNLADEVRIGTEMDGAGVPDIGVLYNFKSFPYAADLSVSLLPIDLLFFKGESKNDNVHLSWATSMEEDFDYFSVERSIDFKEWEEIGQVNGVGNSTITNQYTFKDDRPMAQTMYYRLKAIDFNGDFEYFNVVSVHLEEFSEIISKISVGPNPFQDKFDISYYSELEGKANLVLYNFRGEMVYKEILPINVGMNKHQVFPDLQFGEGNYIMKLEQDGKAIISMKLKRDSY